MQSYYSNSGQIFTDRFTNRGVDFNKMLQNQYDAPQIKGIQCPHTPASWVAMEILVIQSAPTAMITAGHLLFDNEGTTNG